MDTHKGRVEQWHNFGANFCILSAVFSHANGNNSAPHVALQHSALLCVVSTGVRATKQAV